MTGDTAHWWLFGCYPLPLDHNITTRRDVLKWLDVPRSVPKETKGSV